MWKCSNKDCDSDRFIRNDSGTCKYYEINYINGEGTIEETRDTDYEDHEIDDVGDEVECVECGNSGIWYDKEPPKTKWKDKVED